MVHKKKRINWVLILSILAGFLVIGSAIAQYFKEQEDDKKKLAERMQDKNDIIKLQKTNLKLQKESNDTLKIINHLQAQLIESNKQLQSSQAKLTSIQNESLNQITGGGSFIALKLAIDEEATKIDTFNFEFFGALFFIEKVGAYPLYSVKSTVTDLVSFELQNLGYGWTGDEFGFGLVPAYLRPVNWNFPTKKYDVGTITDNYDHRIHRATILKNSTQKEFFFNLKFQWDNGNNEYYITCAL